MQGTIEEILSASLATEQINTGSIGNWLSCVISIGCLANYDMVNISQKSDIADEIKLTMKETKKKLINVK